MTDETERTTNLNKESTDMDEDIYPKTAKVKRAYRIFIEEMKVTVCSANDYRY
jgi:hypothetical protein